MREKGSALGFVLVGLALIVALGMGYLSFQNQKLAKKVQLTWDECTKNSQAKVQLTYPETCTLSDGSSVNRPTKKMNDQQASTSSQFENWKTYENKTYGFYFKMPLDWGYFSLYDGSWSKTVNNNAPWTRRLNLGPNSTKNNEQFLVNLWDLPKNNKEFYINFYLSGKQCSEEPVSINQITWNKFTCSNITNKYIYLSEHGKYLYEFGFNDNISTMNQILSTFKFLN